MPGPVRAAIYTRYSSDRQRDASIEDQERGCRRRAGEIDYEVISVYADRALSGAEFLRPEFQRLIEDARRGRMNVVLAESLDRFSRDQEHIAGFYKTMRHLRVRVVTMAEGEINELHIGLKGTMNALYLKDLGEKTHRGLEGRVCDGKSAGGRAYGYRPVSAGMAPDGTPLRGDLAIVHEEAEVVRRIFTMYASGVSPKRIASMLNEDRIPGPRGGPWQFSTIYGNRERGIGILNNELYVGRRVWNRQRFVKDPRTGKRQARPNDDEALVVKEVPALRIVDDALWDAVKRRQASLALEDSHQKPWDRRRPRYLFSGLMACGVCCSGFSLISPGRLGCSAARNKGETVCTNRSTITREDLEARVLTGLTQHLMDPELVRVFCEEYTAELNRLRAGAGAARAGNEAELAKVRRDHAKLVDAILAGVPGEQVKDRMIALDAKRQQLEAELSASAAPDPVRLHPGMADVYRQKVRALVEGLSDAERVPEVTEALRALVDRIVLTPELRPGRKRATLTVDLEGALAGILHLAAGEKGAAVAASIQNTLSASGGVDVARARNAEEPPVLANGGSSESMSKLVAGAGYNEERTARELRLCV